MLDFFKGTVTPKDWAFVAAVLAITVVLVLGFYFGLQKPKEEALASEQKVLGELNTQLKNARRIQENIGDLREEAEKMERLVRSFQERLPEEREIPRLLSVFEALGDEIGLEVELKQLRTMTDDRKETIPYEVTARGDFHRIVSFINELERDQRYLKIDDLDIGEQEEGISEAQFTLSTFRFIQETAGEAQ